MKGIKKLKRRLRIGAILPIDIVWSRHRCCAVVARNRQPARTSQPRVAAISIQISLSRGPQGYRAGVATRADVWSTAILLYRLFSESQKLKTATSGDLQTVDLSDTPDEIASISEGAVDDVCQTLIYTRPLAVACTKGEVDTAEKLITKLMQEAGHEAGHEADAGSASPCRER